MWAELAGFVGREGPLATGLRTIAVARGDTPEHLASTEGPPGNVDVEFSRRRSGLYRVDRRTRAQEQQHPRTLPRGGRGPRRGHQEAPRTAAIRALSPCYPPLSGRSPGPHPALFAGQPSLSTYPPVALHVPIGHYPRAASAGRGPRRGPQSGRQAARADAAPPSNRSTDAGSRPVR